VLGVVAALSFLWVGTDNTAMWKMIVLGALIALDALMSLADAGPGVRGRAAGRALLFISPWVLSYTSSSPPPRPPGSSAA
jgi:hypothetical protein